MSEKAIGWFVGDDRELISRVRPVLLICAVMPLLVSLQNALQGFLVSQGHTWCINQAAWVGAVVMLGTAYLSAQLGQNGAIDLSSMRRSLIELRQGNKSSYWVDLM